LAVQTGTAVPHISGSQIREFRFRLPPLDEQRAIAHILGTLDDKIELNRRMNETLEEIARTLFTSWFVTFDPVRAKAEGRQPEGMDASTAALFPDSFVGSELGEIPAGWEVRQLAEILDINPTRALRKGDEATYLDMANVPTSGPRAENWRLRPFNSGSRFRNGDVLLARITPCLENGKTCYVDFLPENETGWGSTEFIVLHSRPPLPEVWAYCLARDPSFREHAIRSMSGSSGRQRVPADAVSRYRVAIPSDAVSSAFAQIVNPLFESIRLRDEESRTLAEIRDVPLPKLLSGEIYVRDLDRAVEYAASFNN
jgi:type I restriction enzyme S subunit